MKGGGARGGATYPGSCARTSSSTNSGSDAYGVSLSGFCGSGTVQVRR